MCIDNVEIWFGIANGQNLFLTELSAHCVIVVSYCFTVLFRTLFYVGQFVLNLSHFFFRIARQTLQSLPPILDMLGLLLFVMLIFSILGMFLQYIICNFYNL